MKINSLRDLIRLHRSGALDLVQVFGICLILVFVPLVVGYSIALPIESLLPYSARGTALFLQNLSGLLTIFAGLWWCAGVHAMCLRCMERSRMVKAIALFLVAAQGFWWVAVDWTSALAESTHQDWNEVWSPVATKAGAWHGNPVRVLPHPMLHRLDVSGEIDWGSAKVIEAAIAANPDIRLIEIDSVGGYVHEANLIVDIVSRHELDTLVRGKCFSACTEIFLAGKRRFASPDARFGFHQSGYRGRANNSEWSISEYESAIYYRGKGISTDFTHQALNTSYYDLWRPDVLEVKSSGFATDWWSERPRPY